MKNDYKKIAEHGGNAEALLKLFGAWPKNILDFSQNINPLGIPPGLKRNILKNFNEIMNYPQPDSFRVRKLLASSFDLTADNIAVGNGSIELIYLLPKALGMKKVLICGPAFSEYEKASKLNNAKVWFYFLKKENGFDFNPEDFKAAVQGADAVFLCNPNNPTAVLLNHRTLKQVVNICAKNKIFLIIDEAFMDFVEKKEQSSLIKEAARNNFIIVIKSMTKLFAIAGLRLGYVVATRQNIKKITAFQYPWNVNVFAQLAAKVIIKDKAFMKKTREFMRKENAFLAKKLNRMKNLKVYPSKTDFILCRLMHKKISTAFKFQKYLSKEGIVIRNCANFQGLGSDFFRVAIKKRNDNLRLLKSLKNILDK